MPKRTPFTPGGGIKKENSKPRFGIRTNTSAFRSFEEKTVWYVTLFVAQTV